MKLHLVYLDMRFLSDIVFVCPCCGMFMGIMKDIEVKDAAEACKTGILNFKCLFCHNGKRTLKNYYIYFQALGMFVHSNCLTHQPYYERVLRLYEDQMYCTCQRELQMFCIFKFEKLPCLCGNCGNIYFPFEFMQIADRFNLSYTQLYQAQYMQIRENYILRELKYDSLYHVRKPRRLHDEMQSFYKYYLGKRPELEDCKIINV